MIDMKQVNETLNFYIRPQTFPVAVKICQREEEVPERARRPLKDFGFAIPICQGFGIARRYGWTVAIGGEDEACPFGALSMGFVPPRPEYLDGSFAESIGMGPREVMARNAEAYGRLEYGKYSHLLLAPIHGAAFEPDLIVVYGNSAQVMRLIQGCLLERGGALTSSASGGMDCADIIPQTILSDECQFVIPCNGDRIFGLTQDHELVFTLPRSKVEMTLQGLETSHKSGAQRYPIPSYLRFEAPLPPHYYKLMDFLKEEAGKS